MVKRMFMLTQSRLKALNEVKLLLPTTTKASTSTSWETVSESSLRKQIALQIQSQPDKVRTHSRTISWHMSNSTISNKISPWKISGETKEPIASKSPGIMKLMLKESNRTEGALSWSKIFPSSTLRKCSSISSQKMRKFRNLISFTCLSTPK